MEFTPPFAVPPLSERVTLIVEVPAMFVWTVYRRLPLASIVKMLPPLPTTNRDGLETEKLQDKVCEASFAGPELRLEAKPETTTDPAFSRSPRFSVLSVKLGAWFLKGTLIVKVWLELPPWLSESVAVTAELPKRGNSGCVSKVSCG